MTLTLELGSIQLWHDLNNVARLDVIKHISHLKLLNILLNQQLNGIENIIHSIGMYILTHKSLNSIKTSAQNSTNKPPYMPKKLFCYIHHESTTRYTTHGPHKDNNHTLLS